MRSRAPGQSGLEWALASGEAPGGRAECRGQQPPLAILVRRWRSARDRATIIDRDRRSGEPAAGDLLALPEAAERSSHGEPSFFVGKQFVMLDNHHHGVEHLAFWCAAPRAHRKSSLPPIRCGSSGRPTSATGAGSASASISIPTGTRSRDRSRCLPSGRTQTLSRRSGHVIAALLFFDDSNQAGGACISLVTAIQSVPRRT